MMAKRAKFFCHDVGKLTNDSRTIDLKHRKVLSPIVRKIKISIVTNFNEWPE